jgi:hypothetical protein
MKTHYNDTFRQLLTEYNLPEDLSFSVDFPKGVQEILDDEILETEFGITLKSFNTLHELTEDYQSYSEIEDFENHFHVDGFVDPPDNKKAFMLAAKTLTALAIKFQKEKKNGIRFWSYFQTPEMSKRHALTEKLHEEGDEYLISDRLTFYTRPKEEESVEFDDNVRDFWARLIIDI